ncbi:GAF domain-containing protein [Lapidilactobacillus bayanensis]|uniref:GAF domain-containing protein n=1 Tax=Lapidilactobacillus bayanensis TaxID=2485998 RepID=UPI000F7825A6|nr:GAF domain-containing protein [Lapidilactobacillus bayanensis]
MDKILLEQFTAIFADDEYRTSNHISLLANASAFIMELVPDLNWAGFYLWEDRTAQLELGPFQGRLACATIANQNGVCGTAFAQQKALRVANVHEFAGHIACDTATNSEMVLPLTVDGQKMGVLDLDSPKLARFSEQDQEILTALTQKIGALISNN